MLFTNFSGVENMKNITNVNFSGGKNMKNNLNVDLFYSF